MKYRVVYTIGYLDAWFDFDSIGDAGDFAKTLLIHQIPNDDTKDRKIHVTIQVIDLEAEKAEAEDE